MFFSLLFYGPQEINPEDFVFSSQWEDWNPLVVYLSRAPLFQDKKTLVLNYSYSKEKDETPYSPLETLLSKVNWKVAQEGYNAVVLLDYSRLFYDILSVFRSIEGERAGKYAFSLIRAFTQGAVGQGMALNVPVFFHAEERRLPRRNSITSEIEEYVSPALGKKTLEVLLPSFNFVAYVAPYEEALKLFFKTKTGRVLVKDPLRKLIVEEADLGLLSRKIASLMEERTHAY